MCGCEDAKWNTYFSKWITKHRPLEQLDPRRVPSAVNAIRQALTASGRGITADTQRQRENTFFRFKAWFKTYYPDDNFGWLHPTPTTIIE